MRRHMKRVRQRRGGPRSRLDRRTERRGDDHAGAVGRLTAVSSYIPRPIDRVRVVPARRLRRRGSAPTRSATRPTASQPGYGSRHTLRVLPRRRARRQGRFPRLRRPDHRQRGRTSLVRRVRHGQRRTGRRCRHPARSVRRSAYSRPNRTPTTPPHGEWRWATSAPGEKPARRRRVQLASERTRSLVRNRRTHAPISAYTPRPSDADSCSSPRGPGRDTGRQPASHPVHRSVPAAPGLWLEGGFAPGGATTCPR